MLQAGETLIRRAAGPDELADNPHPAIGMFRGKGTLRCQKPARIAGDFSDVYQFQFGRQSIARAAQLVTQRRQLVAWYRHQHRLVHRQAVDDEARHEIQVLLLGVVKQRGMDEASLLGIRPRGHLSAPRVSLPTPRWTGRRFLPHTHDKPSLYVRCQSSPGPGAGVLEPPGGGSVQVTTDAVAGKAVVAGRNRLENPKMSVLNRDDVAPGRQRLPGAGPVPSEQLDDYPKE